MGSLVVEPPPGDARWCAPLTDSVKNIFPESCKKCLKFVFYVNLLINIVYYVYTFTMIYIYISTCLF